MQISINYFEVVARFKLGFKGKPKKRFKVGCADVFPYLKETKAIDKLYNVRNGLYHMGDRRDIALSHPGHVVYYDVTREIVLLDPHSFVRVLRQHLRDYCDQLLDENNTDLRMTFEEAFDEKYAYK